MYCFQKDSQKVGMKINVFHKLLPSSVRTPVCVFVSFSLLVGPLCCLKISEMIDIDIDCVHLLWLFGVPAALDPCLKKQLNPWSVPPVQHNLYPLPTSWELKWEGLTYSAFSSDFLSIAADIWSGSRSGSLAVGCWTPGLHTAARQGRWLFYIELSPWSHVSFSSSRFGQYTEIRVKAAALKRRQGTASSKTRLITFKEAVPRYC